jgi:hypothetical protein
MDEKYKVARVRPDMFRKRINVEMVLKKDDR